MFVTEKQLLSDVLSKKQNIWLKLLHCTSFIPSLDTRVKSVLSGLLLVLVLSNFSSHFYAYFRPVTPRQCSYFFPLSYYAEYADSGLAIDAGS